MAKQRLEALVVAACLCAVVCPASEERLSLAEAREVMVRAINRDRASVGAGPVALCPVATLAAQRHAEEMAANQYMSHWNLAGETPDERYTASGGRDAVFENVYLRERWSGQGGPRRDPMPLASEPTFSRADVEAIERAYFNQAPPRDGHRRTVIGPQHTHVGIGLALACEGDREALANAQEFVDRYVEVSDLPRAARVGAHFTVAGRVCGPVLFDAVSVARFNLPAPTPPDELRRRGPYCWPEDIKVHWTGSPEGDRPQVRPGGRFAAEVTLSDAAQPGVYFVRVWVRRGPDGEPFVASQRTIRVGEQPRASGPARGGR